MKKAILQLSLLASALFLASPFSVAAESAAATMAEILVNLNHFPSDADKDRLADIMESDETSDAEVDIAMAISHIAHQAKDLGIEVGAVKTDYGVAMKRSRKVSEQNSKGVEFLMKKNKVTVIKGTGTLLPGKKVKVGADVHEAKKAVVIATGSRVKGIPQIGLDINKTTVISSDEALFLEAAPKSMIVVGAGAVGSEFADIFNAFGTKVTLVEALPRILPIEDAECSDALAKSFKKRGIDVLAGAKVVKATVGKDSVTLDIEAGGEKKSVTADKVLMAAGRAVNTEGMGFKEAGVQLTDRGFVKVNPTTYETTAPGVYCIGDVAGPPMLAHKGSREGVVVAERIAPQLEPRPAIIADQALEASGMQVTLRFGPEPTTSLTIMTGSHLSGPRPAPGNGDSPDP